MNQQKHCNLCGEWKEKGEFPAFIKKCYNCIKEELESKTMKEDEIKEYPNKRCECGTIFKLDFDPRYNSALLLNAKCMICRSKEIML